MLPRKGPILEYIDQLPEADRDELTHRLRALFSDEDGALLLDLLDKSTNGRLYDLREDPRASEYAMAWRIFVSDLQLIARTAHAYLPPLGPHRPQRPR